MRINGGDGELTHSSLPLTKQPKNEREGERETVKKKLREETTKIVLSINSIQHRFHRDQLGPSVSVAGAIRNALQAKQRQNKEDKQKHETRDTTTRSRDDRR